MTLPTFDNPEKIIGPGEFFASREDIVISTLLGSCISVALFAPGRGIGGLNHFMLPFPQYSESSILSSNARYGINAMEVLMNELFKLGVRRAELRAKVFGGSTMLDIGTGDQLTVAQKNIRFVFEFLDTEKIPVDSYSVGGALPRKIYFFTETAKVLMRFTKTEAGTLNKREAKYTQSLQESSRNDGKPILFK